MRMSSIATPIAVLVAFTFVSTPSFAQERGQGQRREQSGQESRGSGERAQPRAAAQPRQAAAAPQAEARREVATPHSSASAPPVSASAPSANRSVGVARAVPRQVIVPHAVPGNAYAYHDGRYVHGGYAYAPRYVPYVPAPRYYVRPYVFRPHVSIGFGIFAGFPVPYAYSYPYPIAVYGYRAPSAPVIVGPGSPYYGGIALEINPPNAEVYVDGGYAGYAGDFDGRRQPLTVTAGTHRVEVQAPGYAPLIIDVQVQPGQVVPYRGDMRPY